ncbi:MAG TPA: hypothetical protein EYH40_03235 [Desulfurococcales archaeon]|nr:hypothetical protein [Desulfurococcales archaeon]
MPLDNPLDHEFFIDKYGVIYCVVGYSHPKHKIISYPKYTPSTNSGKLWVRRGVHYERVVKYYTPSELCKWSKVLEGIGVNYVEYDYFYDTLLVKVPKENIMEYYEPSLKLRNILHHGPNDTLEYKVLDFIYTLSCESGIPISSFGISGSILIGLHHKKSDMDVIVYGLKNGWNIKYAISELINKGIISRLSIHEIRRVADLLHKVYKIPYNYALDIVKRRWRRGIYMGTLFSITPVLRVDESKNFNTYGRRVYRNLGLVVVKAEIVDNTLSIVYPSIYEVEAKSVNSNYYTVPLSSIRYITSYNSIFLGVFNVGEIVRAVGILQQVTDLDRGETYYQVLVGARENPGFIVCLEKNS